MSADAQHFAKGVLAAFRKEKRFTVDQVVAAGGPSTSTMTKLRAAAEGGPLKRPRGDTMRRIETAANWPDGAASVFWETGQLPDAELARSIGTGGTPAPEVSIHSSRAIVEMGTDGPVYIVTTSAVDRTGHQSALEVRYTPGAGREVTLMDLGPVASRAHHEVVRATYLEGTRMSRSQQGGGAGEQRDAPASQAAEPELPHQAGEPSGSKLIVERYLAQADGDPAAASRLLAHDGAKGANVDVFTWTAALEELHRLEQEEQDRAARSEDDEPPKMGDD